MSHHPMHYHQHDDRHETDAIPSVRCDRCEGWLDGETPTETNHGSVCTVCAKLCDDCDKPHVAIHEGCRYCGDCESARGEDQDEASYRAFHGGAAAFNDVERNR